MLTFGKRTEIITAIRRQNMKKIFSSICFLAAAILYATDQINLHLSQIAISNMGVSVKTGYIDNIFTVILALIFTALGIYFLVKKDESTNTK